jgi:chemotaxis protein MotB
VPRRRHHHDDDDHEEHGNHEAWVIPYADMLTLLMGLFLVLWAIGSQDLAKLREFSRSFAGEIGISTPLEKGSGPMEGVAATTTTVPGAAQAALAREQEAAALGAADRAQLDTAEAAIQGRADAAGFGGAISFRQEERGLVVSILSDEVLFSPGSAELRPDGMVVVDAVADALASLPNHVAVEGHTDDVPISTGRFPSNWELSTARAGAVLRYLVERHGIPQARLEAGGYADQRPLEANTTADGRARNRRVDIAVLSLAPGEGP